MDFIEFLSKNASAVFSFLTLVTTIFANYIINKSIQKSEVDIRRFEKYYDKRIIAHEKLQKFSQEIRMFISHFVDDKKIIHNCASPLFNSMNFLDWNNKLNELSSENMIWLSEKSQIGIYDFISYWNFIHKFLRIYAKEEYYPVIGELLQGDFIKFGEYFYDSSKDFVAEDFTKPIEVFKWDGTHDWKNQEYSQKLIGIVGENLDMEVLLEKINNHPCIKNQNTEKGK